MKQEAERLQEEIEAIKAVRERVRAREEALVLGQLRQAVTQLRGADTAVQEQKQAVSTSQIWRDFKQHATYAVTATQLAVLGYGTLTRTAGD